MNKRKLSQTAPAKRVALPFNSCPLRMVSLLKFGKCLVLFRLAEKIINGFFASVPRSKPNSDQIDKTLLIAHRGAHNLAQGIIENTLDAFRLAQKVGCWGIEFDVHATADNILVVNHDPTLNRLWGHDAAIALLSFGELRALEPGIPSLEEVVSEYGGTVHLFIELKAPFQDEYALVQSLQGLSPGKDYHLLALEASTFSQLSQFPKEALLLVAVHNNSQEFCDLSLKENYGGVMGSYLLLTNKKIRKLNEANQAYGVGFVDSKYSLYREMNRGVHWIFTNSAVPVSHYLHQL